ncbi:MAG: ABC transporter permease [Planctomycetota bacterium]|nr:ABC transporter permease [Planctomycetota bacterium]
MRFGWRSVTRHRLRSGLAVLGIVFGVASLVAMLAIGEGSSQEVQRQINQLGATIIIDWIDTPSGECVGRNAAFSDPSL